MRLHLLSYDYPPNDGGISRLANSVAEELLRRDIPMEVLTLAAGTRTGPARAMAPTIESPARRLTRDWATLRYLRRLPRDATILATLWNPEATLAWLSGRRRFHIMAHGNELMAYPAGPGHALKQRLRQAVLGGAKTVICNSRYTEGLVRGIQPAARTVVLCPAVDADRFAAPVDRAAVRSRFGLPSDQRLLLTVARLCGYKAHDVVLRALAALPQTTRARLHYAVAGKGETLAPLQALARQLGIADGISWLGYVSDEDLPALYGAADLFVLCTREDKTVGGVEGFGMAFLEAQAAGLAVLGTDAGGIPDAIVKGEGGWLVPQDDSEAVARHLQRLSDNPEAFAAEGERGRQRARREACWARYVDRLLAAMEDEGD